MLIMPSVVAKSDVVNRLNWCRGMCSKGLIAFGYISKTSTFSDMPVPAYALDLNEVTS